MPILNEILQMAVELSLRCEARRILVKKLHHYCIEEEWLLCDLQSMQIYAKLCTDTCITALIVSARKTRVEPCINCFSACNVN